jgi:hypothetical protein
MDVIAIKQAVEWARKWTVEEQQRPLVLEFLTYRLSWTLVSWVRCLCRTWVFKFCLYVHDPT